MGMMQIFAKRCQRLLPAAVFCLLLTGPGRLTAMPTQEAGPALPDERASEQAMARPGLTAFLGPTMVVNSEMPITGIGLDPEGHVFVAGLTDSPGFPMPAGAYDTSYNGGHNDIFVVKLDKDLKTILAGTFLGGEGHELCKALLVDRQGAIYLAGSTTSNAFPVTGGSFQAQNIGARKAFLVKLDNNLSRLEAASLFAEGTAFALASDRRGDIYVGGVAYSGLPGELSENREIYAKKYRGGETDGFIAKFNQELTSLISMTLLGGQGWDVVMALATDNADAVYATGFTDSADFPASKEAFQAFHAGGPETDAFVVRMDERLSNLEAATFLGGKGLEKAFSIAYDPVDRALYVGGRTGSADFPVLPSSFDNTFAGGESDGFVSRFDTALKTLSASTFLGGMGRDQIFSLLLWPAQRRLVVVGDTDSPKFEKIEASLPAGMQATVSHAFALSLDKDLSQPRLAFLGGNGVETAPVAMAGEDSSVYIAGNTSSRFFGASPEGYLAPGPAAPVQGFVTRVDGLAEAVPR